MANDIRPSHTRYGTATIALHWIMLLLIAAVYATIELRELFPRGSDPRTLMKTWHFALGLSVFGLVWVRLLARRARPSPPIDPAPPAWQQGAAKLLHLALYALMVAMPLAGWALLSAEGAPIRFFGIELPPLVGRDHALAEALEELHEIGGTLLYFLVGAHALAALVHHYLLRDNSLRRMLPGRDRVQVR